MALTRRRISPVMPVPMSRGRRRMVAVVLCRRHCSVKSFSVFSHAAAAGVDGAAMSSSASMYWSP